MSIDLEWEYTQSQGCIAELKSQIEWDNERQFYLETCRDELEKKLADALEEVRRAREAHELTTDRAAELERERKPLMEFVVCARIIVEELRRELAQAQQALRLACKYQFDEGLLMPGGKMAKNWQELEAMFIERARKEP